MAVHRDRPLLSPRFEEALAYAARLHARQARKGSGVPYVSHLLSVAALVLEHGGDEEQAIAALLHDALEDQADRHGGGPALAAEIERRFGPRVRRIVEGCSDWRGEGERPPWLERKRRYLRAIEDKPADVRLVTAADKLHNLRSLLQDHNRLGEAMWARFTPTPEQALWYHRTLLASFQRSGDLPETLLQEIAEALEALQRAVAPRDATSTRPRAVHASPAG